MDDPLLMAALQVGSLALAAWLLWPRLLVVLGRRQLQNGFSGGPEELQSHWLLDVDAELVEQLTGFGFQPLGLYWERMSQSRTFRELVYVSPADQCFGLLYPNSQIMPHRASCLTVFADGAVVQTKNYDGGVKGNRADFVVGAPPSAVSFEATPAEAPAEDLDYRAPLDEVLQVHRARVQRFVAAGRVPRVAADCELFLHIQQKYHEHPYLTSQHRSAELTNSMSYLFVLVAGPVVLGMSYGFDHPAPWLVLALEGVVGLAVRYGFSSAQKIAFLRRLGGDAPQSNVRLPR